MAAPVRDDRLTSIPEEIQSIVDSLTRKVGQVFGDDEAICTVYSLNRGRSRVHKYRVEFQHERKKSVHRYLVRVHQGEKAAESGRAEKDNAAKLNSGSFPAFFAQLWQDNTAPEVVVYRYTDDELGRQMAPLADHVGELAKESAESLQAFAQRLETDLPNIMKAYDDLSESSGALIASDHYLTMVEADLPPDLVIPPHKTLDPRKLPQDLTIGPAEYVAILKPPTGGMGDLDEPVILTPSDLKQHVESGKPSEITDPQWYVVVMPIRERHSLNNGTRERLVLAQDHMEFWLTVPPLSAGERSKTTCRLYVSSNDSSLRTGRAILQSAGLPESVNLDAFRFMLEDLPSSDFQLAQSNRHRDLHGDNLVVDRQSVRVIDLGDMGPDLSVCDTARLEVSLWFDAKNLSPDDAKALLKSIDTDADTDIPTARSFVRTVRALRRAGRASLIAGHPDRGDAERTADEIVAYAAQVMFWLRYVVSAEQPKISEVFGLFAAHQLKRLEQVRGLVDSAAGAESTTGQSKLRLIDLWSIGLRETIGAAGENGLKELSASPEMVRFIDHLKTTRPEVTARKLTDFQEKVYEQLKRDDTANILRGSGHVVLAGPTSCGKSTVADLFLAHSALTEVPALYIAPTRALAQQKHRDLLEFYGTYQPQFITNNEATTRGTWAERQILLSTGEDTTHDVRIANGRFRIACMVYEKANVLFSRNKRFLEILGFVIVDEFHMIADLQRGPLLELALSKVLRIGRDDPNEKHPRVVAVSTEGTSFDQAARFLATSDDESDRAQVIASLMRPLMVEHFLLLPDRRMGEFRPLRIVSFMNSDDRKLSTTRLKEKQNQIQGARSTEEQKRPRDAAESMRSRLDHLLQKLRDDHYRDGHRVLVFVPSKREAEELAQRLAEHRRSPARKGERKRGVGSYSNAIERLEAATTKKDEDRDLLQLLKNCATLDVFVHHADVSPRIRRVIEEIWATPPERGQVQVMFATETLKYGVNLAVDDVVLYGTQFYRSPRHESDLDSVEDFQEPLDTCSFHNMVGRSGRLGKMKEKKQGRVYILVPEDVKDPFKTIVDKYYSNIEPTRSVFFHEEDRKSIQKYEKRAVFGSEVPLTATDLTHPFVVALLDAVRYHCLRNGSSFEKGHFSPCAFRTELLPFIQSNTFFGIGIGERIRRGDPKAKEEWEQFCKAAHAVLQDVRSASLGLVKLEDPADDGPIPYDPKADLRYTITDRGDALIDTGTEIRTVQPMLKLADMLEETWRKATGSAVGSDRKMPVELLLLCLLSQREVYREYLRKMPEMAESHGAQWEKNSAAENRRDVFQSFEKVISSLEQDPATAERLADSLRADLQRWEKEHVFVLPPKYEFARTDAVLRMFCAVMRWCTGEEFEQIKVQIEEGRAFSKEQRKKFTSFRTFKDQLAWKMRCLAYMVDTSDRPIPYDERRLYRIEHRVRLGCHDEGIALFHRKSRIDRSDIVSLLKEKWTAENILRHGGNLQVKGVSNEKVPALRAELEHSAQEHFGNLETVWCARLQGDQDAETLRSVWKRMRTLYKHAIDRYPPVSARIKEPAETEQTDPAISAGMRQMTQNIWSSEALEKQPNRRGTPKVGSDDPEMTEPGTFVRIDKQGASNGFDVVFENTDGTGSKVFVHFRAVEFRHDGHVRDEEDKWVTLDQVIDSTPQHVVLIAMPYLPYRLEPVDAALKKVVRADTVSIKFISPAAFLVLMTMLKRDLMHPDPVRHLLTRPNTPGHISYLTIADVLKTDRERIQQLSKLRESLMGYFGG